MGMALAVYKIYPEEGVTLDSIIEGLKKNERIKDIRRVPIAFGIELIKIGVLMDDKKDNPELIEQEIMKISGIKEMEAEDITLIS